MSSVIVRMKFTAATFVRLRDKIANRTYVLNRILSFEYLRRHTRKFLSGIHTTL